jgi:membrane protein YdbS with pleckstrin-like domain
MYHIQWLNDGGKIKVTRSVRTLFRWGLILIMLIVMLFLWKHGLCYWVDLGNMILIVYIMVVRIIILSCLKDRK